MNLLHCILPRVRRRITTISMLAAASISTVYAQSPSQYSAVEIGPDAVDQAVAKMDGIVADAMDKTGVPGMAVAIVHNDQIVYAKGFGVKQVGTNEKIDEATVFQIASLSKSVSATVIAALVSDGVINWDTPVVEHLPSFQLSDPYVTQHLTIGDLFSHRSGLPDHAGDLLEDLGYDREAIFNRLRFLPLNPFRIHYAYTNFGLTAASISAANAADMPWDALTKHRLFDQLGMTSTSMNYADFIAQPNKALGNMLADDGSWTPTRAQRQPDAQAPAGGVSSNVLDLANWIRMVLAEGKFDGKTVIDADALKAAITPQIFTPPLSAFDARPSFYGFGFGLGSDGAGRVRFSHSGGFLLGTGTNFVLLPSENLGIVVLTNGTPVGAAEAVAQTFLDYVESGDSQFDWLAGYQQLFIPMRTNNSVLADKTPPVNPTPAPAAEQLIGHYANDYFGPLEVVYDADDKLAIKLGPQQTPYPLTHWDGAIFSCLLAGENAVGISAVTFNFGSDGVAESITLEQLDEYHQGTFSRK